MLAIANQTAGPNWLTFFREPIMGALTVTWAKIFFKNSRATPGNLAFIKIKVHKNIVLQCLNSQPTRYRVTHKV